MSQKLFLPLIFILPRSYNFLLTITEEVVTSGGRDIYVLIGVGLRLLPLLRLTMKSSLTMQQVGRCGMVFLWVKKVDMVDMVDIVILLPISTDIKQVQNSKMNLMESGKNEVYSVLAGFPVTYSSLHGNKDCRIFRLDVQENAWASWYNDNQQWVQISSIKPEMWIAVITQGRPNWKQWVEEYQVSYTMNGMDWSYVDGGKKFTANKDLNSKVRNNFENAVYARAIRIHPTKWFGHISMRFDAIFIET